MSTLSSTQGAGAYANGVSSGAESPSGREQKHSAKNFRIQGFQISDHNYIIFQKPLGQQELGNRADATLQQASGQSSQMSSGSDDAPPPGDVSRLMALGGEKPRTAISDRLTAISDRLTMSTTTDCDQ